jgi:group I intron endonuclease
MSDDIYDSFFAESTNSQIQDKTYYILYQTTNLVNQKIYVGKHVTKNLNDGYIGSGKLLKKAIGRYGIENFCRTILQECLSFEELNKAEAEVVTEEFIARDDTYNLTLGGNGGWYHVNSDDRTDNKFRGKKHSEEAKQKISAKLRGRSYPDRKRTLSDEGRRRLGAATKLRLQGKPRSEETKKKISETQRAKTHRAEITEQRRRQAANARLHKPAVVSEETKKKVSESVRKAWDNGKRQRKDYRFLQADIDAGLSISEIESKHRLWRGAVRHAYAQGHISHVPERKRS